jgi:hypothetical protein
MMNKYVVCITLILVGCGGSSVPTPPVTLSSIAISPDPVFIGIGTTLSLTAIGTYSNSTTADVSSQVTWKSAAPTTARVGSTGIVTLGASVASGDYTTITAALNGVTSAAVTVTITTQASISSLHVLNTARYDHTATLLHDGTVLVAGGYNNATLASAELYEPTTQLWTTTRNMGTARRDHTATLLATGQVLLIGGGDVHDFDSADLYTPSTSEWTSYPGVLTTPRSYHTATLLNNPANTSANGGKELVLVVGGGINSSSDLYDPTAASSVAVADTSPRYSHTATLLNDGRVLVAGGFDYSTSTTLASAVLYDPSGRVMNPTGDLATGRYSHTATLVRLADSTYRVLVTGGTDAKGQALASAELYDPSTGIWSPTHGLAFARSGHIATLMPDGKVLVVGGNEFISNAELYDPLTKTWTATANLQKGRYVFSATLLNNGSVLVVGGLGVAGPLSDVELHN